MKKNNNDYFGFVGTSEFLKYDWDKFVNFVVGQCVLSIGRGDFKDALAFSLRQAAAWGLYHNQ